MTSDSSHHPDQLFFDGDCGLCHTSVRFVLKRDQRRNFRYAPLSGITFEPHRASLRRGDSRARLPDSIVVVTAQGDLLLRSDAVGYILKQLGGVWRIPGAVLLLLPRPLRDFGYGVVARVRHRLFRKPADICPIPPGDQRTLFDP